MWRQGACVISKHQNKFKKDKGIFLLPTLADIWWLIKFQIYWKILQSSICSRNVWRHVILISGCDEKLFSTLETGTRISFFQSHVREENENFFLSISYFETRTRACFQSREREFLFSISGFETRTRIEIKTILTRIFGNYIYCLFIDWYFQKRLLISQDFLK